MQPFGTERSPAIVNRCRIALGFSIAVAMVAIGLVLLDRPELPAGTVAVGDGVKARPDWVRDLDAPASLPEALSGSVVASRVESITPRHVVPEATNRIGPTLTAPPIAKTVRDHWTHRSKRRGRQVASHPHTHAPEPTAPAAVGGLLDRFDSIDAYASPANPPDANGAAGPTHVVNAVNFNFAFHRKSDGVVEVTGTLPEFFAPLNPQTTTFDPKVVYDPYEDRFVVMTLEFTDSPLTSRILFAVSDDSDPNGTWYYTAISSLLSINQQVAFGDFPGFAFDEDAVYITLNMFNLQSGGFIDSRLWIIDKGAGTGGIYEGGAAAVRLVDPPDGFGTVFNFALQPARMLAPHPDPDVGTFLTTYNGATSNGESFLHVLTVIDPLGIPTLVDEFVNLGVIDNVPMNAFEVPQPVAVHRDLTANDRLALSAAGRGPRFAVTTLVIPPDDQPDAGQVTAHWALMDGRFPGETVLIDQGNIGGEDIGESTATFYPSVAFNFPATLALGFSASGPEVYPGAYYTFRRVSDPPGTVRPSRPLQPGLDFYVNTSNPGPNRWGDYSGIAVDPIDACFWVYNQYAAVRDPSAIPTDDGVWGTAWGRFCPQGAECGNDVLEPGETCDPPGATCNDSCSFCGDGNVDIGETCDPPGPGCRDDCTQCGDGLIQPGEQCDDFNQVAGDGCDDTCRFERCGNGIVQSGETCDPPAGPEEGATCRSVCNSCGDGVVDGGPAELILNGDFETGHLTGWETSRFGVGLFVLTRPGLDSPITGGGTAATLDSGAFHALSDMPNNGTHAIAQTFTVPDDATQVLVEFDMFVNDYNGKGAIVSPNGLTHVGAPNQHARVDLVNPGFGPFDTSFPAIRRSLYLGVDAGSPPNPYTRYTFDVTGDVVPGATYSLRFADSVNQFILNLGVDNVSVRATIAATDEACDDGNVVDGDGCSRTCEIGCGSTTNTFDQTVRALDDRTFGWALPVDATFVRGDLASVDQYAVSATGTLAAATELGGVPDPRPGKGLYVLLRVDCPDATWDSGTSGQCCSRDAALP